MLGLWLFWSVILSFFLQIFVSLFSLSFFFIFFNLTSSSLVLSSSRSDILWISSLENFNKANYSVISNLLYIFSTVMNNLEILSFCSSFLSSICYISVSMDSKVGKPWRYCPSQACSAIVGMGSFLFNVTGADWVWRPAFSSSEQHLKKIMTDGNRIIFLGQAYSRIWH